MRAYLEGVNPVFLSKLLQIGDGTIPNDDGYITIDKRLGHIVRFVKKLITKVYP